jgi:hypothetical protein
MKTSFEIEKLHHMSWKRTSNELKTSFEVKKIPQVSSTYTLSELKIYLIGAENAGSIDANLFTLAAIVQNISCGHK